MRIIDESIEQYVLRCTAPEPELLERLAARTGEEMPYPQMLTGRVAGRFLAMLVRLARPRLILEIGTFTGYSALSMAEALPAGSRIVTCEIDPKARDIARAAFDESGYGDRIELRFGPALDTIRALDEPFDFAFIDADKINYPNYYEEVVSRIEPGGLIVIDNALFSGEVLEPGDDSAAAIARTNEMIRTDERVENVLVTVRDGMNLVRRRC